MSDLKGRVRQGRPRNPKSNYYQGKYAMASHAASEEALQELFETLDRVAAGYTFPAFQGAGKKRTYGSGVIQGRIEGHTFKRRED